MSPHTHDKRREECRHHLVVKRGHHGRYRFALMIEEGRITGEVVVEAGGDRDLARARAVAKIAALAQTLSASLPMERPAGVAIRHTQRETDRADENSFACEPILGVCRGQI